MKKLILSILASAAVATAVQAQDGESSPLTMYGSVDSYYRTTLNTSDKGALANPGTSFANGVGFDIGMINLGMSKEGEKSGFVADLVFGPRGDEATFSGQPYFGTTAAVNQLYAYYNITDKLTFTLGNFNTFLGYEVISPAANFNYSTSYLFSYGPFSHTGAKLNYAISDNLSAMVSVMNPTDFKTPNGINNKYVGAQVGYSNDALGVYVNYLGGQFGADGSDSTSYNQIDLTAGLQASDDFYVGLNATYATAGISPNAGDKGVKETGFAGIALYAQYAISDAFTLGFRGENTTSRNGFIGAIYEASLDSKDAAELNTKGSVTALTLTGSYTVGDLTLKPEIRTDIYSKVTTDKANPDALNFMDDSAAGDLSDLKKGISSFTLAAVYAF